LIPRRMLIVSWMVGSLTWIGWNLLAKATSVNMSTNHEHQY
jgi:hypothetical protein